MLSVANDTGKFWYQADALGSVYGLTNQAGALVGHQSYDVFGAPTPAPSGPAGQPFGFTGREHELDSGLVYARARYLNPALGRWTAPDPIGQKGGVNYFVYTANSPTVSVDPMGLFQTALVDITSMDKLIASNPTAGILLAEALGVISVVSLPVLGVADMVARQRCSMPEPKIQVPQHYYRGLSGADYRELGFTWESQWGPRISSGAARSGMISRLDALATLVIRLSGGWPSRITHLMTLRRKRRSS